MSIHFTETELQELAALFGCSDSDVYSEFAGYDVYKAEVE